MNRLNSFRDNDSQKRSELTFNLMCKKRCVVQVIIIYFYFIILFLSIMYITNATILHLIPDKKFLLAIEFIQFCATSGE